MTGRERRLLREWEALRNVSSGREDISVRVVATSGEVPVAYEVEYCIRSICGVGREEDGFPPVFADVFTMRIDIPDSYPCIDAMPSFRFLTCDAQGRPVPHPWHPNIRYYGDFAGRVCINFPDSFSGLDWAVLRVASYLTYECYHAVNEPPYPEDQTVAAWVIRQGEKNDWIYF